MIDDTTIDSSTMIDLTDQVVLGEGSNVGTLDYQAPDDGKYLIAYYWQQGTAQEASPAAERHTALIISMNGALRRLKSTGWSMSSTMKN